MTVKILTEYYLEFLCLNGGCTGSSEYTLVKMPHCWKSHVVAQTDGWRDMGLGVYKDWGQEFILFHTMTLNKSKNGPTG